MAALVWYEMEMSLYPTNMAKNSFCPCLTIPVISLEGRPRRALRLRPPYQHTDPRHASIHMLQTAHKYSFEIMQIHSDKKQYSERCGTNKSETGTQTIVAGQRAELVLLVGSSVSMAVLKIINQMSNTSTQTHSPQLMLIHTIQVYEIKHNKEIKQKHNNSSKYI